MSALFSLYRWQYARSLIRILQQNDYHVWSYLRTYWRTQNFDTILAEGDIVRTRAAKLLMAGLRLGMFLQLVAGLVLLGLWRWNGLVGGWQFGSALVLAYPIVWAHLAAIPIWLSRLLEPKKLGRAIVCSILERQVRRLRVKHDFKVVAVVGSIGKTSTKAAIAKALTASKRVMWQEGNYNDRVTVPLIFFNQHEPNILNIFSWLRIFFQNNRTIRQPYPYDIVVAEIGPDGPNQMKYFDYIRPDILVLTAITPEHMEYFGTLDAVAAEELTLFDSAKQVLVNIDDTPAEYLEGRDYLSYGLSSTATYYASKLKAGGLDGQSAKFYLGKDHEIDATISMLGDQGAKVATAAAATASVLGLKTADIKKGLQDITAFAGRMQILPGLNDSKLIDDTYNATPIAVNAALDVLYKAKASQRIAILGSMNELGDYSESAHREVGEHCDPKKLDLVVTIGRDANTWLAPLAEARGCKVKTFLSPYDAGKFVKNEIKQGAVVLAKGSQNGVFAEEALKVLLENPDDASKFVRQSEYWMNIKRKQFKA
jgi:UDP-N-acetylmuramoyl-tripeptide--D-alanyl-D-alanine ligase